MSDASGQWINPILANREKLVQCFNFCAEQGHKSVLVSESSQIYSADKNYTFYDLEMKVIRPSIALMKAIYPDFMNVRESFRPTEENGAMYLQIEDIGLLMQKGLWQRARFDNADGSAAAWQVMPIDVQNALIVL